MSRRRPWERERRLDGARFEVEEEAFGPPAADRPDEPVSPLDVISTDVVDNV